MKKAFKSYTSFTRIERMGFVGLCAVLIIFIGIRVTMHLWVQPANDPEQQKKLIAAWETFKRSQPVAKTTGTNNEVNDYQDASDNNEAPLPGIVDINTADSATLVRFKGIGPVTAGEIIVRRKKAGPFTNIDQLLEIRKFPDATFNILKKHLVVGTTK